MFVLKEDNSLVQMKATQFTLENDFQRMLEDHPELLAGELIDPEEPRIWLLVKREMGIPGEESGSDWLSADHLFLDQDGIPTIVEVKRQTDTRLRREVIAQMIDYAANAASYWTAESIRESFRIRCDRQGKDCDEELQSRFGEDLESDQFWAQVKQNLDARKLRLLLVADQIPPTVRTVVEFLNSQLNPTEILALELRQFVGENGLRTIVPTLYGQTEQTRRVKSGRSGMSEEPVARSYWEAKNPNGLRLADVLLHIAVECGPGVEPKYNRPYIGMMVNDSVSNFITVHPKRGWLRFSLHRSRTPEIDAEIASSGIQLLEYKTTGTWKAYRMRLTEKDIQSHRELLAKWIRSAYEEHEGR